jgi:hypothetical protein
MKTQPKTKRVAFALLLVGVTLGGLFNFWFRNEGDDGTEGSSKPLNSQVRPSTTAFGGQLATAQNSAADTPKDVQGPLDASAKGTSNTKSVILFTKEGTVEGQPLPPKIQGLNPQNAKGRVVHLKPAVARLWTSLQAGDFIELPSFEDTSFSAKVNLRTEDNGWLRFGGELKTEEGSFSVNIRGDSVGGSILLPSRSLALEIVTEPSGEVLMVERPLSRLICWPGSPVPDRELAAAADTVNSGANSGASAATSPVPRINTRPGAKGLIYLNFEGETVTDSSWNNGQSIVAAPAPVSADAINEIIARVAEDYAPFDLAISTIREDYDNAPVGRRIKVIITPTDTALRGVGGVSFTFSWSEAGGSKRSSTIPAWVFVSSPAKTVAEIISHEVGHTLGLSHDGTMNSRGFTISEYYTGNGGTLETPTSWAPIMGTAYNRSLSQWSKGEYANANNTEDDLAIISSSINGFDYASAALAGDGFSLSGTALIPVSEGTFALNGVLRQNTIPDAYEFYTTGGTLTASIKPAVAKYANADLQIELLDAANTLLAVANPPNALEASLAKNLAEGTYRLLVRAAQNGTPVDSVYTSGYSSYDSLGAYQLSGTVENCVSRPTLTSASQITVPVDKSFTQIITLSPGAHIANLDGNIPPGLAWNPASLTLSGTPTELGTWTLALTLSTPNAIAAGSLTVKTYLPTPSFSGIIGTTITSPLSPWTGQSCSLPDGSSSVMAASGNLPNSASTFLRFRVPGKSVVSFLWKTSTEADHDVAQIRVNGLLAKDLDTGTPLSLSGESGWVARRFAVETTGPSLVEVRYTKDANISSGQDRVWFGNVVVGTLPVFKKAPLSQRLKIGQTQFSLTTQTDNANTFIWKKDGIPLSDGTFEGVEFSGTRTPTLSVSGATGKDSGAYTLAASNEYTTVTSRAAEIAVPGAPVIGTHGILVPKGLKTGDTLLLSVEAFGAKPLVTQWKKDGQAIKIVSGTTLQIRNAQPLLSGSYSVTVLNMYGKTTSTETPVLVSP